MNNDLVHAFYSNTIAESHGFCLCNNAENPDEVFRVTHIAVGEKPQDIVDLEYVGIIQHRQFKKNHYHLPGKETCITCIHLRGTSHEEEKEEEQETEESEEPQKRKVVKVKRVRPNL